MSLPRVEVSAPIRNRAWILPRYLRALEQLDYPPELLSFRFIVNDSRDFTFDEICRWFDRLSYRLKREYYQFSVERLDTDIDRPADTRGGTRTSERLLIYPLLARLRNHLVDACLEGPADYMFSVDSDVLVQPDTLSRLLTAQRDVVAAVIQNGPGHTYNFLAYDEARDCFDRVACAPPRRLFAVGLTGAVCLYSRRALECGRFAPGPTGGGEDEGMARSLRAAGVSQWVDGRLRCEHVMEGP